MNRVHVSLVAVLFTLGAFAGAACSKAEPKAANANTTAPPAVAPGDANAQLAELAKRVKRLEKRQKKIEDILKQAGVPLDGPPEADPAASYSVPLNPLDPVVGSPQAKVTIVEAFDFA